GRQGGALGAPDDVVARNRRAANAHAASAPQRPQVAASLAIEQHDRLAVAERAAIGPLDAGRRAHAAGPMTPRARLVSISATSLQEAHTSPHDGMPQRAHVCGARWASSARAVIAGRPLRWNSRTKASLVPGLAASRRLRASL